MNYPGEKVPLGQRIKKGNEMMWQHWFKITRTPPGPERKQMLQDWDKAKVKIEALCEEFVRDHNFRGCLYIDEQPQVPCMVCPLIPWTAKRCPTMNCEFEPGPTEDDPGRWYVVKREEQSSLF